MITIPYLTAVSTYFSYGLLFAFGQLRDYSRLIFDWWRTNNLQVLFVSHMILDLMMFVKISFNVVF